MSGKDQHSTEDCVTTCRSGLTPGSLGIELLLEKPFVNLQLTCV